MKIGETPAPEGVPLRVGDTTTQTGADGSFSAQVLGATSISISSDLPAIAITPVVGLGTELRDRSPLTIPAFRLLEPGATGPCRAVVGLTENIFWSYRNLTSSTLEIPLTLSTLNNFQSPRGEAMPETLFAPNMNSFSRPLSQFSSSGSFSGIWNILGLRVQIPNPLPLCSDSGDGGGCKVIASSELDDLEMQARQTVQEYSEAAVRLRNQGIWRPNGARLPFAEQAARMIAAIIKIRNEIQPVGSTVYRCEPLSLSRCQRYEMPKDKLRDAYSKFFNLKLPPQLESINTPQKIAREMKQFEKQLKDLPRRYVRCETR